MTEEMLKIYRLYLRIHLRDVALEKLVQAVQAMPGGSQSLADWANRVQLEAQAQTIPGVDAAISDQMSAEYQEALKELFDGLV